MNGFYFTPMYLTGFTGLVGFFYYRFPDETGNVQSASRKERWPLQGFVCFHYLPINPGVHAFAHIGAKFPPAGVYCFHGFIRKP
jgi:hypothetical protein